MIEAMAPPAVRRAQRTALRIGAAGALVFGLGCVSGPAGQAFRSYLFGYVFWAGLSIGCLGVLMLAHLTGGSWGAASRRIFEAGTQTLPLMALLFVPLPFGFPYLYPWARAEIVAADLVLQHKALYLNGPFLVVRSAAYFVIWIVLASRLTALSSAQDRDPDALRSGRLRGLSAAGLVGFGLTGTFAAIDWVMSLEPDWYSTIFSSMVVIGSMVSALALAIAVLGLLRQRPPLDHLTSAQQLSDVGSMTMAFLLLWAYLEFSQFMLIWAGNLPDETSWYLRRMSGGFEHVAVAMVLFAFAVPFVLLFSARVRHDARLMAWLGLGLLASQLVSTFWLVSPSFTGNGVALSWLDLAAPLSVGGFWTAVFLWRLGSRPLVPLYDPRFVLDPEPQHG